MPRIRDQRHRIGQKTKATLDDHECQIQPYCDRHPGIDALCRYAVCVTMPVVVPMVVVLVPFALPMIVGRMGMRVVMTVVMVMLMFTMVVLLHGPHLTSVAQVSAFGALAANMGAGGRFTKGRQCPGRRAISGKC